MATIVLQVQDESLVSKVKQACKMLMGVTIPSSSAFSFLTQAEKTEEIMVIMIISFLTPPVPRKNYSNYNNFCPTPTYLIL
jgi:hypothetical protein